MSEHEHPEATPDDDARPQASDDGEIDAARHTDVEPGPPAEVRSTGDARVDEALRPLRTLDDAPVHDHPTMIEDLHRTLQDILAEERD